MEEMGDIMFIESMENRGEIYIKSFCTNYNGNCRDEKLSK